MPENTIDYRNPESSVAPAAGTRAPIVCAALSILLTILAVVLAAFPTPPPLPSDLPTLDFTIPELVVLLALLITILGGIVGIIVLVLAAARKRLLAWPIAGIIAPIMAFLLIVCVVKYQLV